MWIRHLFCVQTFFDPRRGKNYSSFRQITKELDGSDQLWSNKIITWLPILNDGDTKVAQFFLPLSY
jgi:hypothetical protein